mmetsp:Transcript_21654/g.54170  ORF Transcript_21654/g.54170 Transcript_21654/m.54170 type:complete len:245 (-) Transcript_21654:39-773(-)
MSTGKNLATMPSSTRERLHESGCSMITTFIPRAAARSKVNLFPGKPAEMNTTVAPLARFLRKLWLAASALVRSCGGTLASIWYVAVGKIERIAASRSSTDMGLGRLPGLATICSISNLERWRENDAAVARPGWSVSNCVAKDPCAASTSLMVSSKSQSRGTTFPAALPGGTGEAQSAEAALVVLGGDGKKVPAEILCNAMASCMLATCFCWLYGDMSGTARPLVFRPLKHPPQALDEAPPIVSC